MVPCDCCGRHTDERSLKDAGIALVCPACFGVYSEEEIQEMLEQRAADQSGKPDSTTSEPKPGPAQKPGVDK